jgi:non-ribosomal peptide synthetase component E (peptide arylation enzyme)
VIKTNKRSDVKNFAQNVLVDNMFIMKTVYHQFQIVNFVALELSKCSNLMLKHALCVHKTAHLQLVVIHGKTVCAFQIFLQRTLSVSQTKKQLWHCAMHVHQIPTLQLEVIHGMIASATQAIGKDLKRMCKKYETKIASFQSSSSFLLED